MREGAMSVRFAPDVIATSLRLLEETPIRIGRATAGVAAPRLHRRTDDEPWSVNNILAHLRAAADVRERFIEMSSGDHPTLRFESPRSELRKTDYGGRTFADNLAAFGTRRAALLDRLTALPMDGWSRGSLIRDHPESVATCVRYLTEHETVHCADRGVGAIAVAGARACS